MTIGNQGGSEQNLSRAERRRLEKRAQALPDTTRPPGRFDALRQKSQTGAFRFAVAFLALGFVILALSQSIPHEYGFLELGWLFTFSVYDLVLAMLGLSIAIAMASTLNRAMIIAGVFLAVMLVMLLFFDTIFFVIRDGPLGQVLYLIAPTAVVSAGIVLWLPASIRDQAAVVSAVIVSFSMSLFIGLDDMGVGIADFASGTLFSSLWLVLAPGLMLRQFAGPWLTIPARIIGSWLMVIAVVITVSLYMPNIPFAPPPPQLGTDTEQNYLDTMPDDGSGMDMPAETENQPAASDLPADTPGDPAADQPAGDQPAQGQP